MITRKLKQFFPLTNHSGFTIIESLMAIVVVGILMSAIAPAIALSVATRVQARRVEIATQVARTYIDGLKSGTVTHTPNTTNTFNDFKNYAAPTSSGSINCTAGQYCSAYGNLYCVAFVGNNCKQDSRTDMFIQTFRWNSVTTDQEKGYLLGLRVYRADAFNDRAPLVKGRRQATFTNGLGDRKAPLVEMTTEITTNKTTFRDYCDHLHIFNTTKDPKCKK